MYVYIYVWVYIYIYICLLQALNPQSQQAIGQDPRLKPPDTEISLCLEYFVYMLSKLL